MRFEYGSRAIPLQIVRTPKLFAHLVNPPSMAERRRAFLQEAAGAGVGGQLTSHRVLALRAKQDCLKLKVSQLCQKTFILPYLRQNNT